MAFGRRLLLLLGLFAFEAGQASDKPFVLMKHQNPRTGSKKTSYKKPLTFASNISNSTMSPYVNYCGFGVIGITKEAVVNVSIPQTGKSNTKVLSITTDSPTLSTVYYKINAVNGTTLMNPSGDPTNPSSSPETNGGPRSVIPSTPENGNPENESSFISSKSCKMEERIPELIVSVSVGTQPNQTQVYAVGLTDQLLTLTIEISTGFSVKPRLCASPNNSASVFIEFVSINTKNAEVTIGSWGYGQTATEASISHLNRLGNQYGKDLTHH
ncbi:uncharacterized protein LOC128503906 [Spea bombifrons]|uniref:uncharacterized protein LOC128503906 n=1 Tax=Spea bombifrons TaxID=233779 RepID=UPI0023496B98|nr:uncharacterized protein LOC128503906 [Spea bombifrons]